MGTSRWVAVAVMVVVATAGCSSRSRAPAAAVPSPPRLDVVLDDHGLHYAPRSIAAGHYVVSFEDHRSPRPAGQRVDLQFAPSGPLFVVLDVHAGARRAGTVLANEIAWVAIDGVRRSFAGEDALTITTSPQFPTPAT